ncbi:hypothetical protein G9A89_022148 [Geosiphon pyriformis]|nr:hypothetical protein G9A89_022148 [Geosiphon pyriformis]
MKDHFGVLGNECADMIAGAASLSSWYLSSCLDKHFIMADYSIVFGNSRHFKVGSSLRFLEDVHPSLVWHSDLYMATGFTNQSSVNAHTYFMKILHHCLPIVIQKRLYSRLYPSVLCLYCGNVEVLDYAFSCRIDESICRQVLAFYIDSWKALSGLTHSFSCMLQLLLFCTSGSFVSTAFFKGFVFDGWFYKTVSIFCDPKVANMEIVKFVHSLSVAFRNDIWLVHAKHCTYMKKNSLISLDSSAVVSVFGLALGFSVDVLKLLGIADAFGIHFGFHKSCSFFLGISGSVSVHIAA